MNETATDQTNVVTKPLGKRTRRRSTTLSAPIGVNIMSVTTCGYVACHKIRRYRLGGPRRSSVHVTRWVMNENVALRKEAEPPPVRLASSTQRATTVNNRFRASHSVYSRRAIRRRSARLTPKLNRRPY